MIGKVGGRPRIAAVVSCACVALAAGAAFGQLDTGPNQQTLPFFAPFGNTINSAVSITGDSGPTTFRVGSGAIVGKRTVNGENWLCVLTADHVAIPTGLTSPLLVGLGDGFTQLGQAPVRSYGGANNVIRRGGLPVAQGGLGGVDIALIGVQVPAGDTAFGLITPMSIAAVNPATLVTNRQRFTEMGYGGTGSFVNGGMNGAQADGNKRFQNNEIERTSAVNSGGYAYTAIEWNMQKGAAPANPTPFLVAEGLSFGGDSGGPYVTSSQQFTTVNAFTRDGPLDPNNWTGGLMPFFSDTIIGVHTYGNSTNAGFNAYGTTLGGGVPLIQAYVDWINTNCMTIPAPSGLGVLFAAGIVAIRRRRR